ncbi:MAG TPA: DUF1638 domain-containing protein [Clostridia bacterium]|nr:DUF1638 domain-containing protein [Clostridia bacterium]
MERIKLIACEAIKEELLSVPTDNDIDFEFLEMEKHNFPKKLNRELQSKIDAARGYSKVILGLGLCGGALNNLRATNCPLIIPKVHDCIALLLGSGKRYEEEKNKVPGTYFLSKGLVCSAKSVLAEYARTAADYGEEEANGIFEMLYKNYKRILYVNTFIETPEEVFNRAKQTSRLLKLSYEETFGTKAFFDKLINGPWDEDFIHISHMGNTGELII